MWCNPIRPSNQLHKQSRKHQKQGCLIGCTQTWLTLTFSNNVTMGRVKCRAGATVGKYDRCTAKYAYSSGLEPSIHVAISTSGVPYWSWLARLWGVQPGVQHKKRSSCWLWKWRIEVSGFVRLSITWNILCKGRWYRHMRCPSYPYIGDDKVLSNGWHDISTAIMQSLHSSANVKINNGPMRMILQFYRLFAQGLSF